ncbi:MAG: histidine kinase dimerization/phospho-acceptor domain-containing protein, partial [Myxococcota bacterium]
MLCVIAALYATVRFTQRVAPDADVAVTWTRLQFAVGVFLAPAAIGTLRDFGGTPKSPAAVHWSTAAAALYTVLILNTDLFFSGEARSTVDALGAWQLVAVPGRGMFLLALLVVPAVAFCGWQVATGDLTRHVRIIGGAVVLLFAASAANDALFRAGTIHSAQVLELGVTAIAVSVGYVSIHRFRVRHAETSAALEETEGHRKRLQEVATSLEESEARLREFADASLEGIALVRGSRIVDVNAPLLAMTGRARDELLGEDIGELGATGEMVDAIRKAVGDPGAAPVDVAIRGPNAVTYEMTRRAGAGGIGSLSFRDVTHRKLEEHGLVLAERVATYSTLAAATAHEVNNPLAAVVANLDLLDEELARLRPEPDLVAELLRDARHGTDRIRVITADLRGIGKAGADASLGTCAVEAAVDSALRLTRNLTRHNIAMTRRGPDTMLVKGDEAKLTQVLVNLI